MKLCIRQKVFSWVDRFTVFDENGADKYYVEGELFSWGKKLRVTDVNGREAAFIQQKVSSFTPRFFCVWTIEGDFWLHEYRITQNGREIVSLSKEWFTWGDCYALDIVDPKNETLALAVVLAIDAVHEQAASAASASH